jgi:hypothetical protein
MGYCMALALWMSVLPSTNGAVAIAEPAKRVDKNLLGEELCSKRRKSLWTYQQRGA